MSSDMPCGIFGPYSGSPLLPPPVKNINISALMVLSVILVLTYMVLPIPANFSFIATKLQINRLIGFYPFFLLGIYLKKNGNILNVERNSKMLFAIAMTGYLSLCYIWEGFAYKGSFYLQPSSGIRAICLQMMSYPIIMLFCVTLVYSMPHKEVWLSRFGGRTLNVYLLHMLVVFPVCYGIFSHLGYNIWLVMLNSVLASSLCLLFFSATVDRIMKKILSVPKWTYALSFYAVSLVIVNSHVLLKVL